jgi:hypothetical protein
MIYRLAKHEIFIVEALVRPENTKSFSKLTMKAVMNTLPALVKLPRVAFWLTAVSTPTGGTLITLWLLPSPYSLAIPSSPVYTQGLATRHVGAIGSQTCERVPLMRYTVYISPTQSDRSNPGIIRPVSILLESSPSCLVPGCEHPASGQLLGFVLSACHGRPDGRCPACRSCVVF